MKRREAVNYIFRSLEDHPIVDDLNPDYLLELSEDILKIIENMGMFPPLKVNRIFLTNGDEKLYFDHSLQWEEE